MNLELEVIVLSTLPQEQCFKKLHKNVRRMHLLPQDPRAVLAVLERPLGYETPGSTSEVAQRISLAVAFAGAHRPYCCFTDDKEWVLTSEHFHDNHIYQIKRRIQNDLIREVALLLKPQGEVLHFEFPERLLSHAFRSQVVGWKGSLCFGSYHFGWCERYFWVCDFSTLLHSEGGAPPLKVSECYELHILRADQKGDNCYIQLQPRDWSFAFFSGTMHKWYVGLIRYEPTLGTFSPAKLLTFESRMFGNGCVNHCAVEMAPKVHLNPNSTEMLISNWLLFDERQRLIVTLSFSKVDFEANKSQILTLVQHELGLDWKFREIIDRCYSRTFSFTKFHMVMFEAHKNRIQSFNLLPILTSTFIFMIRKRRFVLVEVINQSIHQHRFPISRKLLFLDNLQLERYWLAEVPGPNKRVCLLRIAYSLA